MKEIFQTSQIQVMKISKNFYLRTFDVLLLMSTHFVLSRFYTINKFERFVHLNFVFFKFEWSVHLMYTIFSWIFTISYFQFRTFNEIKFLNKSIIFVHLMYTTFHWIFTIWYIQQFLFSIKISRFCMFNNFEIFIKSRWLVH